MVSKIQCGIYGILIESKGTLHHHPLVSCFKWFYALKGHLPLDRSSVARQKCNFSRPMPFWDERHKKALIRLRNRRDLVMIDRMSVYEVQLNNRISVIPEKWPGRRNFHIKGRNFHNLGENRSTFWGENFHIDNCTSEDVKTTLAWRHKILKLNRTIIFTITHYIIIILESELHFKLIMLKLKDIC